MTSTLPPTPQTPGPVEQAHGQRARIETIIAVCGALFTGVAMLSGLAPIAQYILSGAVGMVFFYVGIAYARKYLARKRRV